MISTKKWVDNLISPRTVVDISDGGKHTKPQVKLRFRLEEYAPPKPRKPENAFWTKRIYYQNAPEDLFKRHKIIEYHKSKGMKHLEDFEEIWETKEAKAVRRCLVFIYTVEAKTAKDVIAELKALRASFTKEDWEYYIPPPQLSIVR